MKPSGSDRDARIEGNPAPKPFFCGERREPTGPTSFLAGLALPPEQPSDDGAQELARAAGAAQFEVASVI